MFDNVCDQSFGVDELTNKKSTRDFNVAADALVSSFVGLAEISYRGFSLQTLFLVKGTILETNRIVTYNHRLHPSLYLSVEEQRPLCSPGQNFQAGFKFLPEWELDKNPWQVTPFFAMYVK